MSARKNYFSAKILFSQRKIKRQNQMKDKIIDSLNRLWFPILMLLCFLILTIKFSMGQSLEIKEALRSMELDQGKKALTVLNQATKNYPADPIIKYHLGMTELKNGQRESAASSFDKGIALNEKEALNYVGRGYLSMLEDNLQKAELDFNKALALSKSKNINVLNAIAAAYLRDSKLSDKALALLLKSKAIDDRSAETFILLGDAYLAQNNGGLAVTNYERAATLDATSAKPYYAIGLVYLRSRNFISAQEGFTKAIQIDPNYTLAYKELGELYYQMKDGPNAVKAYETYLSLTDKPDEGKLRYAFFLFMAKEFSKANKIFYTLMEDQNTTATTLRFYAVSLFEAGDYQESRRIFDKYFSEHVGQEAASDYNFYGKLLIKQHEDSLAVLAFQKSLVLEANQSEILQLIGETLFKIKNFNGAIEVYEKLMKAKPKLSSQDLYTVGRAYYFNKQYDKAESVFEKLLELQPNMSVGYLWQARVKSNLDPESENGLAKPYYEKLIEKVSSSSAEKNKSDLLEAYSYLGYYHFLKNERNVSKSYWNKVLELSPADAKAKEALKALQ